MWYDWRRRLQVMNQMAHVYLVTHINEIQLEYEIAIMNQVTHVYLVTHLNINEIQLEEESASNEPSDPCVPCDPSKYKWDTIGGGDCK
jgi:hypothetical protein